MFEWHGRFREGRVSSEDVGRCERIPLPGTIQVTCLIKFDKVRAVYEDIDIPIFLVHNFCLRKTFTGVKVVSIVLYRARRVACLFYFVLLSTLPGRDPGEEGSLRFMYCLLKTFII